MTTNSDKNLNAVAIIGMAGRFPGASSTGEFWENLCKGVESVTHFSDNELDPSIDSELTKRSNYIKARGILNDSENFDASFFKINPREAEMMDPQHRIFLEVAWEALEDSGYPPDGHNRLIGVYAGMGENTYFANHIQRRQDLINTFGVHQTRLLNLPDYLATRVSYKFNLKGPAVSVATGCSTSLVAVCQGVDSLMSYQSDIVIAGGIFVCCPQKQGYLYQEGGILSSDGHCRAFDKDARGTVFSNGAGAIILKRLDEAIEEGDHIYCVIRGTGMNNDGSERVSFTAPSVDGQAQVVALAQAAAGIHPETVTYIEAHGTGTPIGDPIEIRALTQAFRAGTDKKGFCAIGSVKTNIGHLDAAAGVAGLIKTALCLKHGMLPPSIHFTKPNPKLDIENTPFYVNTVLTRWKSTKTSPRRAGVSSFGVGGTNAHVVLEEPPVPNISGKSRAWQLLCLSGKTDDALEKLTANLSNHLKQHPELNPADVAYTLMVGRKHFNFRRMIVFQASPDGFSTKDPFEPDQLMTSSRMPVKRDVVFMFSGQGSQYVNMGSELYQTEREFQTKVDQCSEILMNYLGFDLREVLYPADDKFEQAEELLQQTYITQPALFVIEYALATLWISWGVKPRAMVGHSIGEYVAACLSGVFSLEDALGLVAKRGRLIQGLPRGTMMAVLGDENTVRELIADDLCLAVINGPSLCVVSGENSDVIRLETKLVSQNIHFRYLKTSHAFHSKMLDPVLKDYYSIVKDIPLNPPEIPFVSNASGQWITQEEAMDPAYWVKHLRQTVRFSNCVDLLANEEYRIFLEIGPGQTLASLVRQHPGKMSSQVVLSSTRRPDEKKSDSAFILNTLGHIWMSGFDIDWNGLYADEMRRRVPLPPYPFQSRRHWIEAGKSACDESETVYDNFEEYETPDALAIKSQESAKSLVQTMSSGYKVENAVAKIWKEILGVERVGIKDNFFELGGSSIVALSLFARIEKVFGKKLPLAILYSAPTVIKMAEIIKEDRWSNHWSSLVPIQANGHSNRKPIFFIHGAGGNILIYRDLAKYLGPEQPVYGLQSQGLDGKQSYHINIEDMACHYIREIKSIQPEGPYMLCGYCMGGSVALEMAQQLHGKGDQTSLLALLETYNFSKIGPTRWVDNIHLYLQKLEFHLKNFLLLSKYNKIKFCHEKAKIVKSRSKVWSGMMKTKVYDVLNIDMKNGYDRNTIFYEIWENNDLASLNYIPRPYPGKITQFIPLKEYAHHIDLEPGWEKLAEGGVETYKIKAYPAGMLVEPFVKSLADTLKRCIDDVK